MTITNRMRELSDAEIEKQLAKVLDPVYRVLQRRVRQILEVAAKEAPDTHVEVRRMTQKEAREFIESQFRSQVENAEIKSVRIAQRFACLTVLRALGVIKEGE